MNLAPKTVISRTVLVASCFLLVPTASGEPDLAPILFEDSFDGELAPGWSWIRESPGDWRLRDGALEVRIRPGNLWGRANNAPNVLVRDMPEPEGGVAFEVAVSNLPTEQWEQAGLAWYRDDSNMVKLVKERVDSELWVVMGREEKDRTRTLAKISLATSDVELRMEFRNGRIFGKYRPDGTDVWNDAASCSPPSGTVAPRISLQVYNGPADAEHWARFSHFRIRHLNAATVRDSIGVNIHFTGAPERDLNLLAGAGFGWVRMDFVWQAVERSKGEYHFDAYDALVEGLSSRGIRALFILDYSNRLYETHRSVRTPEGRAAFARFAAAAAERYRGKGIRWEIWNEPNHEKFWTPEPSAPDYLALVRATAPAIRAVDPYARVIGPATSGIPRDFLEHLFENGFLELVDEVSVHPYRGRPPETVLADYEELRALIREHTAPGRVPRPIVSGEWGYSNHHWGRKISREQQAAYLARQFLTNLAASVRLSIWYDWCNDGRDPENTEHNFGTVTHDRKPKPAYLAVKTLTSLMGDTQFEERLRSPEGTHLLAFAVPGSPTRWLAAWSEDETRRVQLTAPGLDTPVRTVDMTGAETTLQPADETLDLELGPQPRYLNLPAPPEQPKPAASEN